MILSQARGKDLSTAAALQHTLGFIGKGANTTIPWTERNSSNSICNPSYRQITSYKRTKTFAHLSQAAAAITVSGDGSRCEGLKDVASLEDGGKAVANGHFHIGDETPDNLFNSKTDHWLSDEINNLGAWHEFLTRIFPQPTSIFALGIQIGYQNYNAPSAFQLVALSQKREAKRQR
jgi:hypothetical protein